MLGIALLGPITVRNGDTDLEMGGLKQRALLARLALAEGRPVAEALLVEDLWGERHPANPRHALQAHVSRLRAVLPVPVERVAGGYRLPTDEVELDVTQFVALCEHGSALLAADHPADAALALRAGLGLWRGTPFAELADITELRPVAVRLEELSQSALTDRIDADLRCGRSASVIPELQEILADNPLRERTWRQLMIALYREGRESEALETYQRARHEYVEQLGSEPGDRLKELHQAILERTVPESRLTNAAATVAPADELEPPDLSTVVPADDGTTFSGRQHELAVLERAWHRPGVSAMTVAITGEPGIGKTRLAVEFTKRRTRGGTRVLFGRCDQSVVVPYQPFKEAIRADLEEVSDADLLARLGPRPGELVALLPELAERLQGEVGPPLRSDPGTELHRIFDAVAGWMAAASVTGRIVVVLDDLQWADRQSLLLLRHLQRSPRDIDAMVLTTFRDRELSAPDASAALLAELTRQAEHAIHLPLPGLDKEEVSALLDAELSEVGTPADSDEDLPGWISSASGGNPLFVVELARQLRELAPVPVDGHWPQLPSGLREVVSRRVAHLPAETRSMLNLAATIGKEFDPLLLRDAGGMDADTLDELLGAAAYARLIEPLFKPRLRYTFCHDVVRAVLYDEIPPLRRGDLHRVVAEALERQAGGDPSERYDALAHHYSAAATVGPAESALRYLMLAGRAALAQRAPTVALEHFRRARDLTEVDAGEHVWSELLTALGTAEFRAGEAAFRETLLEAARLADRAGDPALLTEAVVANNRGWWSSTAEIDHERIEMIDAALAQCDPNDDVARAQLLTTWALENIRDPAQRALAIERSGDALILAEKVGDDELLALALAHRYAVLYASFSDPGECIDLCDRLFAVARRRGDPGLRLNAAIGLAQSTMLVGEFGASDRALAQAIQLGTTLDQPARLWMTRCWEAMRTAMRGDLVRAEELAVAAFELGTVTEQPDALTWFAGQLFTLRMIEGRLPELIKEIEEQVASQAGGIPAWRAAWALTLTTVGRRDEAREILHEFVDQKFAQLPKDMLWLQGMCYLSSTAAALDDRAAAVALQDTLLPHAGRFAHNGTIDAGPVDLYLGTTARLIGERPLAEAHLAAAEALCRRADAPLWLERIRVEQSLLGG